LVIREAAALQTPSILIKDSIAANVITDNWNGFLTENSTESFALKLRELFHEPELIKKVGLNASTSITRSWESVLEEVLERYQKLMLRKCRK
jgi:glycosyltransferase involved in cell wall biosynthesis